MSAHAAQREFRPGAMQSIALVDRRVVVQVGPIMRLSISQISVSLVLAATLVTAGVHCGSSNGSGFQDAGASNEDGSNGNIGTFGDASATDAKPNPIGTLDGKVVAPEGTIPISGALVYLTDAPPLEIPSGVYCDKCVQLESEAFTYSGPDGRFSLPAYRTGEQYLVVQKSQFRRVRRVTVAPGAQPVIAEYTKLPGKNDTAAGDTIPKMKVMPANWDSIAKSLRKLGITEVYDSGPLLDRTLSTLAELSKYHIVFVPCKGSVAGAGDNTCSDLYVPGSAEKAAVRQYIENGGKLYATDWSYEYVRQIWPGYIRFVGENSSPGSACSLGEYSGPAVWNDPSLAQWMNAIGEGSAELKKSYVSIQDIAPQMGKDENGATVTITPKLWASTMTNGSPRKSTVSFQAGCGRVLYSTYHAEGSDNGGTAGLLAQEKALFHVLLEVSECVGTKPRPPR
jgi:hypothetical protein